MQSNANVLLVDEETIVNTISKFFYIHTVWVEYLLDICCDYANVESKSIVSRIKTRWLSLLPVIIKIIDILLQETRKVSYNSEIFFWWFYAKQ